MRRLPLEGTKKEAANDTVLLLVHFAMEFSVSVAFNKYLQFPVETTPLKILVALSIKLFVNTGYGQCSYEFYRRMPIEVSLRIFFLL